MPHSLDAFARRARHHGSTSPLTGSDPETEQGYDGPPAAADQDAVRARLRAEDAEYLRLRDQHRTAA